ncbi:hypothetical protein PAXRUDRAFT_16352 [Paxillus rubicundulus Ve08.2h10]|uniref:Uncharacterized protein n=1 Tax=Paxillus rubicundulus Ve08.2h10 TaxID=930991 RepID=A0A0D0CVD4_9AGAM|nr:hypothetical protein PAXRUDRAFT_16352 [Paxillus rubicundulus Ve08.2h10]
MGEAMLWEAPQEPPPSMISSDQCMETNVGYDQEEAALWQGTDESSQQYFTTGAWTSGIHTLRIPVRKSTQASHGAPPECRVSISATQKLDGVGAHLCAGADEVQPDQPGPVPPPAAPYHRLSMLLHFIRFGVEKHERHKTAAPTTRVPKSRSTVRVPPTPTVPAAPSPQQAQPAEDMTDPAQPASPPPSNPLYVKVNKDQCAAILRKVKMAIQRIMLTEVAVPANLDHRHSLIWRAIDMGKQEVLGDRVPIKKLHLSSRITETMTRTRLAFCAHTAHTVEGGFGLLPPLLSESNERAYKQEAVKKLVDGGIGFLHHKEKSSNGTTEIRYFKNTEILNAIIYVVWKDLQCGHLVGQTQMDTLFAQVGGVYKVVLLEHKDGIYNQLAPHAAQFRDGYDDTINLLTNTIRPNRNAQWANEEPNDDDDDGYH